jgi:hypothetical protein
MVKKVIPETYRGLKIVKTTIRVPNGKVPQLVIRLQCDVGGHLLESHSWRDLELQIDEQLDLAK